MHLSMDFVVMITVILAIGLTIISYLTRAKILNVFIAGLYLNLAINTAKYPALLIVAIGLILLHMYLAFFRR